MLESAEIKEIIDNKPKILYKHFSFNEDFLESVNNEYLWFSKPLNFNDPFDFNPDFLSHSDDSLSKMITYIEAKNKNIPKSRIKSLRKNRNESIALLKKNFNSEMETKGVCCFTSQKDNMPMWAHYSDNHKGLMIEFDPNEDIPFFAGLKVKYTEKLSKVVFKKSFARTIYEICRIKHNTWSYEKEYRIFRLVFGKHKFNMKAIKSIILGMNFPNEKIDEIKKILTEKALDIPLYKVELNKNNLKIEFKKLY
jgi:hypothetical protein